MTNWLNPRVLVIAVSIVTMVLVSKVGEPHSTIRNDWIACLVCLVLYAAAFLVPLQRCFGVRSVLGTAVLLFVAWAAVLLALIADALPVSFYVQTQRHFNWPMIAFCTGAIAAFLLFFTEMSKSFALLEEAIEARDGRA